MADYLLYTLNKQQQFRWVGREAERGPKRVMEMPCPGNFGRRRCQQGVSSVLWQVRAALWAGPALRPHRAPAEARGPQPGPHAEGEGAHRHRWVIRGAGLGVLGTRLR